MPHFTSIGHFPEHPHSTDHNSQCSSRAYYYHSDLAHCHPKADSAPSGYYITPPKHPIPSPPEPSQAPPFVDQTMPPEEPTAREVEPVEPSSLHQPPTTI